MAGFYGKLPAKGDFLTRNLPRDFIDCWDEWLQAGMNASRQALGEAWLQTYLTSPLWRYVLPPGICGASAWAGVVMPSMDKVGRYFPMTVAVQLPEPVSPLMIAANGQSWFEAMETCLLDALDDESLDLDTFDEQLQAVVVDQVPHGSVEISGFVDQGIHLALNDALDVSGTLLNVTLGSMDGVFDHCSVWWGQGSERVSPSLAVCRGLPESTRFAALLDGNWGTHGWSDRAAPVAGESPIALELAD
jgi:type VI secretion system protein ImpM